MLCVCIGQSSDEEFDLDSLPCCSSVYAVTHKKMVMALCKQKQVKATDKLRFLITH